MHAPLTPLLRCDWRPLDALAQETSAWRDLIRRAAEPNIFLEPEFLLPAARAFAPDAGAFVVTGRDGRWHALLPARIAGLRDAIWPAQVSAFVHSYAPLGTPLFDREWLAPALDSLLDYLTSAKGMPRILRLPYFPDEGPVADALGRALAARGSRERRFGGHARAMLVPGADRDGYVEHAVSAKMRKEIARKRRRLADIGEVTHTTVSGAAMQPHVTAFLELEKSGWKGRLGTAAACRPEIVAFVHDAVAGLAREGKAFGDVLRVGETTIALTIMLRDGPAVWAWKIAFDEAYARYSPGVQIALDITNETLADPSAERIDSCATPDHPMIDKIWRERLLLSDRLIALRPGARPQFALACRIEAVRRSAIARVKSLRERLRRRAEDAATAEPAEG